MSDNSLGPSRDARDEPPDARDPAQTEAATIAEEVAEAEAAIVAEDVAETVARRRLRPLEALMLAMLAISLIIHVLTLSRLFSVRNTLRTEIGRLADNVQAAKSNQVRYNLPIDQQIPVNIDVPIKRSLVVPVQTEVRIKQNINLPVDTGLGQFNIPIPLDTTIPISASVPIEFDQTVNISSSVPLKFDVPIQVDLGSSPFSGYLDQLHQELLDLRDKF